MSPFRTLRTARHIPPAQLAARARTLLRRRLHALRPERPVARAREVAAQVRPRAQLPAFPGTWLAPEGRAAVEARAADLAAGRFTYLRRTADFSRAIQWDAPATSLLWRYQLQYLGAALDLALARRLDAARAVVASWTRRHGGAWDAVAWHPYPVSLRVANLCAAASVAGSFDALGPGVASVVATQTAYLEEHLEHDVRGNHILENLFALLLASKAFEGPPAVRWEAAARTGLETEVPEQVLPDGGHFERSPMYHAIVLHRLLGIEALLRPEDPLLRGTVAPAVAAMREFLAGVLCPDGEIPPVGDAVRGFAPPPASLLGTVAPRRDEGVRAFSSTGLHVLRGPRLWAVVDAGEVCPDYLPAHGQADTLTVEVWCDGAPLVGDPGVFDYSGPERAWGRSSRAHSTLTIDDADTSEVYGSFRVGGRAQLAFVEADDRQVSAAIVPHGADARLTRVVSFGDAARGALRISDDGVVRGTGTARSRLHLHPAARIAEGADGDRTFTVETPASRVRIDAMHAVRFEDGRASREFGLLEPTRILVQDLLPEGHRDDVHGGWTIRPMLERPGA